MRYCSLFIVIVLVCLFSSCVTPESETLYPTEEKYQANIFPPSENDLAQAITNAGMDWQIGERPDFLKEIKPMAPIVSHNISNTLNLIVSWLNVGCHYPGDRFINVSLEYLKQSQEEYSYFQKEEWPLFWVLIGELYGEPEAVKNLGEQCMTYFNDFTGIGDLWRRIEWWGKQDDIYCHVEFSWNLMLERYTLYAIKLMNPLTYAMEINGSASYRFTNNFPKKTTMVEEIDLPGVVESNINCLLVKGHIEQLESNYDVFDISNIPYAMPVNIDLYQKAQLVDETGTLPVYLAPTALTESDLAEERLHFVYIINASEPYYVIDLSVLNNSMFKLEYSSK